LSTSKAGTLLVALPEDLDTERGGPRKHRAGDVAGQRLQPARRVRDDVFHRPGEHPVDQSAKGTAALLPAVDLELVMDVVSAGGLLPEKATSFQPKPSLGSFIRLLDE